MDDLKERLEALGGRQSLPNDLLDRTLARFDERRRRRRIGGAIAGLAAMLVLVGVLAVILTNRRPAVPTAPQYHDRFGWSVEVPTGWTKQEFAFATDSTSAEGVQISNVPLPDPVFMDGIPVQPAVQQLPTDGVAIVIAKQVDWSIEPNNVVDLPMTFPDDWNQGSVTGDLQPEIDDVWFRAGDSIFVATARVGTESSQADRATLAEIVRSIRYAGIPTPNPNDTATELPSSPAPAPPTTVPDLHREHDVFGWSVGVPPGWKSVGFGFGSHGTSAEGIQISNVQLPEPPFDPRFPVQAGGQDFPPDGIGIVIAKQVDPSIEPNARADLPLDYPDGWAEGSALGGEPTLDVIWFRGGDETFIATVRLGSDVSPADLVALREIVQSIRFDGIPTPNPNDTVTSIGETDISPGFLPQQVVDSSPARLTVQSPPGIVRWALDRETCGVNGDFLQAPGGGSFGGSGCEGDDSLSWGGPGGSIGGNGEIYSVPGGRVPSGLGITVRITLQNGDVQTVVPQDGLWMAVIGRCHDYVGTEVRRVESLDSNGRVLFAIPVGREEPDPLNPWPPC